MEKKNLTRKELYDLVCSKPLTTLAAEYSVSANGLRKICRDNIIPLPPNGYWSKLKFGKPCELFELSESFSGSKNINLEDIRLTIKTDSLHDSLELKVKDVEEIPEETLKVPLKLINPDPLIIATMNYHDAIRRYDYRNHKPYPDRKNVLNINVSKDCEVRAYRIMDTVIKLLRSRKYNIKINNSSKTIVELYDEEIEIRLREKNRIASEKNSWGGTELISTGKLVFIIESYPRKEIQDGLDPLESKLSSIIACIEANAELHRRWHIDAEEQRKREEEKRKADQEIKHQKDNESQKFKNLFLNATRLHQAKIIREYIRTVEANANENQLLTHELRKWIDWANKKANWYDPLINSEDPILDDNYKMGIFKELLKEWQ